MHDRAQFWSAVPDWAAVSLSGVGIRVAPVEAASIWLVSGNPDAFLARHGVDAIIGPRQCCAADRYVLRLSPDQSLFVSSALADGSFGWSPDGGVVTDISDGMLIFDVHGEAAAELMAQASDYPFLAAIDPPQESAAMKFAGFKVIVSRRQQGWRLHIERPWAPALWRWLQAHLGQG